MRTLEVKSVKYIDEQGLTSLLGLPILENLPLCDLGNSRIREPSLFQAFKDCPRRPKVCTLALGGRDISDRVLAAAVSACSLLDNLYMRDCPKVTTEGMRTVLNLEQPTFYRRLGNVWCDKKLFRDLVQCGYLMPYQPTGVWTDAPSQCIFVNNHCMVVT